MPVDIDEPRPGTGVTGVMSDWESNFNSSAAPSRYQSDVELRALYKQQQQPPLPDNAAEKVKEAFQPDAAEKNYTDWKPWEKRFIVFMVSMAAFFSPLSANVYFPIFNTLSDVLNVSGTLINVTVTTYMVSPYPLRKHCVSAPSDRFTKIIHFMIFRISWRLCHLHVATID